MENLLDGTYVINMDADRDRLNEFDTMMAACNWNYERFPAVNGKQLMGSWEHITDAHQYEKLRDLLALKKRYVQDTTWLSHGEIGCLLSHVCLWEDVANNPEKNRIAIFEDDARTHVDGNTVYNLLTDFYQHLEANNIPEPDMLYLGKALDDCLSYEKVWGHVYRSKSPLCLHAYIITKVGAQKLLSRAPFRHAIDVVPIKVTKEINIMVFHPSLYFQDVFGTTSNLRQLKAAVNNTTECIIFQQHITSDNWDYIGIVAIGLVATIMLFIIFVWLRPWTFI